MTFYFGSGVATSVPASDVTPETVALTYNGDGTINTVAKGGVTSTFAYNGDGSINTITNAEFTKTFSYNGDGTISAVTVT